MFSIGCDWQSHINFGKTYRDGNSKLLEIIHDDFLKYEGMAENHLIMQELGGLHIFCPGYICPVEKRKEPNFTYVISCKLYPLFKLMGKNFSVKSTELGKFIFEAGIKGADKTILENKDILNILEDE
jgi:hypothetical protein